jgi:hypothetical protein
MSEHVAYRSAAQAEGCVPPWPQQPNDFRHALTWFPSAGRLLSLANIRSHSSHSNCVHVQRLWGLNKSPWRREYIIVLYFIYLSPSSSSSSYPITNVGRLTIFVLTSATHNKRLLNNVTLVEVSDNNLVATIRATCVGRVTRLLWTIKLRNRLA